MTRCALVSHNHVEDKPFAVPHSYQCPRGLFVGGSGRAVIGGSGLGLLLVFWDHLHSPSSGRGKAGGFAVRLCSLLLFSVFLLAGSVMFFPSATVVRTYSKSKCRRRRIRPEVAK